MWIWFLCTALAGSAEVVPGSTLEIVFDGDPSSEVEAAIADLRAQRFDEAGTRLAALADAGGGAEVRWLEALAWYEAGELARADEASRDGLKRDPAHASLLCLRGLVLADRGQGTEALRSLDAAQKAAAGDQALLARVLVNRAVVHLDRGHPDEAASALDQAGPLASAAGDPSLTALIEQKRAEVASLRGSGAGADPLDRIGEALSRGDLVAARNAVPAGGGTRREQVRRAIADGAVSRAEGRLEVARKGLTKAVADAQASGLLREQVAALGQLGVVHAAMHRPDAARTVLEEALRLVDGTSLGVVELSYRIEAGRAALRAGDTSGAEAHLAKARTLAGSVHDASATARLAELQGLIAADRKDTAGAAAAYQRAAAAYDARGATADAARVSTSVVELVAGTDEASLAAEKERALGLFRAIGDPLGPSHVGIAEGLGRARAGDLDGAMSAFVAAATAAEQVGNDRGTQMAALAKENAAKVLADLTDDASVVAQASRWGLGDLVERQEKFQRARKSYDEALALYQAGKFDEALAGFGSAVKDLDALGENGYAAVARRARAWAEFNAYTHASAASGFPVWQRLVEEGTLLGDAELRVRSKVAVALAASELGRPEAVKSLTAASSEAEAMGLRSLAGQCQAALVELVPGVDDKVLAARKAFALRDGDTSGQYAMYSAAVAAYEADRAPLAHELASTVLPLATGELKGAVQQVVDASAP